jgi:hypothetical protein
MDKDARKINVNSPAIFMKISAHSKLLAHWSLKFKRRDVED